MKTCAISEGSYKYLQSSIDIYATQTASDALCSEPDCH